MQIIYENNILKEVLLDYEENERVLKFLRDIYEVYKFLPSNS